MKSISLIDVQNAVEELGRRYADESGTKKETLKILELPGLTSEMFRRSVKRLAAKM